MFSFLFHFSGDKIRVLKQTEMGRRKTLGLFCLPMFHKNDARRVWVNSILPLPQVISVIEHGELSRLSR